MPPGTTAPDSWWSHETRRQAPRPGLPWKLPGIGRLNEALQPGGVWQFFMVGSWSIPFGGGNSIYFFSSPRKLGKMKPFWRAFFQMGWFFLHQISRPLLMVQKSGEKTSWGKGSWNPMIYRVWQNSRWLFEIASMKKTPGCWLYKRGWNTTQLWGDYNKPIRIPAGWKKSHLGCIKPCQSWNIYYINWCRISTINSIVRLLNHHYDPQKWSQFDIPN